MFSLKTIKDQKIWSSLIYSTIGIAITICIWQFIVSFFVSGEQFKEGFAPINTFREIYNFIQRDNLTRHAIPSLLRVGIGLLIAIIIGIPVGIMVGYFSKLNSITNTVFQFIRMTSPLAWMPIAIIIFGVGDRPVYFLITVAAVWPLIINTAQGVRHVNQVWIKVVRMLGGKNRDILQRAVIPAIIPDMLTGLRISLGISWIILVPAEMLGVSSGLGYFILDARDRFNYGELMAVILIVGFLGYISDTLLRIIQRKLSWRKEVEESFIF